MKLMRMGVPLSHWCANKMTAIFQKTFSNAFSWMKTYTYIDLDFTELYSHESHRPCCPCPIQRGWQHQAKPNTGSPSISVLRVNPSQATIIDISLDTLRRLSKPSFSVRAGKRKVCGRFYTGRGNVVHVHAISAARWMDCCNIFNAKFLE